MSITSSVTASVARDQIPSNGVDLCNHMYILLLTRGDGRRFDATSIQEEDIKICIWLEHTHPEGVLWYSTVKSVMLFHCTDDMQLAACGVITMMTLHEELITIWTSPPSATHVRAYMAVMDMEPSGSRHPTPDVRGTLSYPLEILIQVGRPYANYRQTLGTLWIMSCLDLCQEVALRDLNALPRDPPPTLWGNPVGNRDPDMDDQEVTFPRGGRWESQGPPLWPAAPTQLRGGVGTEGAPPHLPTPIQFDEDVGHLINTLATGLCLGTPCINTFSGEAMLGKT